MIIKPRIKGFVCITAHPTGCMQNVMDQVEYARKHQVLAEGKPKRVLVFLIEADCALGPEDFVDVAHLPAGRRAAEKEVPHSARFEPAHHLALIVIGDLDGATLARSRFIDRLDLGAEFFDRPHQRQGAIDHRRPLPPPALHIQYEYGRDLRLGFAVIQRHGDECIADCFAGKGALMTPRYETSC